MDITPFILSLKLAFVTTVILLVIGFGIIYLIHFHAFRLKAVLKAVVSLPLVLPPSVLGYYLLIAFQPQSLIGQFSENVIGLRLIFSFPGLVVASIIFSLPFMVNPVLSAIENLPRSYTEAAFTLGKTRFKTFTKVLLPNVRSSIIVGMVMTFAHTIGEFGVILIIGGNIPSKTRVASIDIYNQIEAMNYQTANQYALILLLFSFVVLLAVYLYHGNKSVVR